MAKRLVLIGGGHAHMVTLSQLHIFIEKGFKASVIGPSTHHYYSGMGPGMLGGTYDADDIRFATKHLVEKKGAEFIHDSVIAIDANKKKLKLKSGRTVEYDVLSCNAGSYVSNSMVTDNQGGIYSVKPIESLLKAQQEIISLAQDKQISINIAGGGPSAAEIAGNIIQLAKKKNLYIPQIKIFASTTFMSHFSKRISSLAKKHLQKNSVEIFENSPVSQIETGKITLKNGETISSDLIFLALGVKPSKLFKDSGLPTGPDQGLLVNKYLQCQDYPDIFGGGDCIYFSDEPLNKVGVYAVRQNPVLFHNLMAKLEDRDLMPFDPGGKYLLIFNMGDNTGIFNKGFITFGGRMAFWIKDFIDRRFMKKFQAFE